MTISIDFTRPFTTIGGRLPLRYMQNGFGFNPGGEYLGRCNVQGELMEEGEPLPPEPAADSVALVGEEPGVQPPADAPENNPASSPAPEAEADSEAGKGADLEALTAHYQAKPIKELKAMAKDAGIANASTLNKAALVEALAEHDAKAEDAA
ncbi:Rho termination factor N-terminal domain-containing protein [Halomonas sp. 1390]|uniref:Rho termination factor N-terminal domain-containing protein n=1 Tax=Halomonas sp. B23F22_3 TaxID=3459516 RepID=UPI00373E439A